MARVFQPFSNSKAIKPSPLPFAVSGHQSSRANRINQRERSARARDPVRRGGLARKTATGLDFTWTTQSRRVHDRSVNTSLSTAEEMNGELNAASLERSIHALSLPLSFLYRPRPLRLPLPPTPPGTILRKRWNPLRVRDRGTRRVDKLQGARNNEAPVLGCVPEIGPSRGYKSHGTRPGRFVKRPIDERTAPLGEEACHGAAARPARFCLETFLRRNRPAFSSSAPIDAAEIDPR